MKSFTLLTALLVSLIGCVSPSLTPPTESMAKPQCAYIVPMESPPLGVPP